MSCYGSEAGGPKPPSKDARAGGFCIWAPAPRTSFKSRGQCDEVSCLPAILSAFLGVPGSAGFPASLILVLERHW